MNSKLEIKSEGHADYISFKSFEFLEPRPKPRIDSTGHASDSSLLPGSQNTDSSCAMKTSPLSREARGRKTLAIYFALTMCQAVYLLFHADHNFVGQILSFISFRLGKQFENLNISSKSVQLILKNFIWHVIEYRVCVYLRTPSTNIPSLFNPTEGQEKRYENSDISCSHFF